MEHLMYLWRGWSMDWTMQMSTWSTHEKFGLAALVVFGVMLAFSNLKGGAR